jgi:hypothetical protein
MKLKRYAKAELIRFALEHPDTPNAVQSEPHCIMDLEPVWTVLWKPDSCGGFPVATGLRLAVAKSVAAKHDEIARDRSWAGRSDIVMGA